MRLAISGTHATGKSTLIDRFLLAHPEFRHEPEPFWVLQEDFGEVFAAEPAAEDFHRQLTFNLERLRRCRPGDRVIFERCPIDFLAYLRALGDLRGDAAAADLADRSLERVQEGMGHLDGIVFLPLDGLEGPAISKAEDPELRLAVDEQLIDLLAADALDLCHGRGGGPRLLEVRGSTEAR